jgi:hypothetical protein
MVGFCVVSLSKKQKYKYNFTIMRQSSFGVGANDGQAGSPL